MREFVLGVALATQCDAIFGSDTVFSRFQQNIARLLVDSARHLGRRPASPLNGEEFKVPAKL
jgi:hypothetical protein